MLKVKFLKNNSKISILVLCISIIFLCNCDYKPSKNSPLHPTLSLQIQNFPNQPIYLAQLYGDKPLKVDTLITNNAGSINFTFPAERPAGMYRIYIGQQKQQYLEFIYNKEDITLSTDINNIQGQLKVLQSTENQLYQSYLQLEQESERKLGLLWPLLKEYPKESPFYEQVQQEHLKIEEEKKQFMAATEQEYPNAYATKLIRFYQIPTVKPEWTEQESRDYLKARFLESCDFNDTSLHYSAAYNKKLLDYLRLFSQQGLNRQQQIAEFIQASSSIMERAKVNSDTYIFVLGFLLDGFEQLNMKEALTYLADTYDLEEASESCENEDQLQKLQQKIAHHQQIAVGKMAPDISFTDIQGNTRKLSDIQADYKLLIFWSSQCPHCQEMLPQLKNLYDQQSKGKLEVVAISLDEQQAPWQHFIEQGGYTWINSCDFQGWQGAAATAYHVYATPVMVLMDGAGRILGKPREVGDIPILN